MAYSNKKFFTTGDIARIFGVSRISAYKWVTNGKIKAFKIPGGRYKVTKKDLSDFIKKSGMDSHTAGSLEPEGFRILIVDDENLVIQTVQDYMKAENPSYIVTSASDGFEAGRILSRVNPDIVILDLFMPGINGFNLCRNIRNDPNTKHIKIIAITGYPSEANVSKVKEAGADAVLPKPFEMTELDSLIKKLLR